MKEFLMRLKTAYRLPVAFAVLFILIALNLFFSLRDLPKTVSFTQTTSQLFYNSDHPEETYPGAILPLIVADKTVHVKDDITHYEFDMSDPDSPWEDNLGRIYYGLNSKNLLEACGANVISDGSLNEVTITKEQAASFADLGASNDLYRFSCATNDILEEYGHYFHYYYMYTVSGAPMHIYLNAEDAAALLPGADTELVALWQRVDAGFGEDLFLMSREYYDKEVAK